MKVRVTFRDGEDGHPCPVCGSDTYEFTQTPDFWEGACVNCGNVDLWLEPTLDLSAEVKRTEERRTARGIHPAHPHYAALAGIGR